MRDLDVGEFLASLRDELPDLSLPRGMAPNGVYLGGVWLLDRERAEQRDTTPAALVFYGEAHYQVLQIPDFLGSPAPTLHAGFSYQLDGDRMTAAQFSQGHDAPPEDAEEETIAWRYEGGRLHLGESRVYRPADLAELIAEGFDADVVRFVELLARSADPDFRERVDALPLRSAPA